MQSGSIAAGSARREQVVDRGTVMSGGMLDRVGSAVGLEGSAQRMGALLAKQYVITYGPGGGGGTGSRRKVSVGKTGLRVLAPTWAPIIELSSWLHATAFQL